MVRAGLSKQRHVTWRALDLSWLEQAQARPVGGGGAAHLDLFYVSWRLWRLICTCFTCPRGSGRLICKCFTCPGGSARLICTCATCPGGSGGVGCLTDLSGPKRPGGSAKEDPHGRGGRVGEGVGGSICRVLRGSEALGGSFVRVLRVGEALGGSDV